MKEKNFNYKPQQEINKLIIEVHEDVLQGEGSEGLQKLENLEAASEEFLYNLQQLHGGEGESAEEVANNLNESVQKSMAYLQDAIEGEGVEEKLSEAAVFLRDLDRRAERAVGVENAIFSELDDEQVIQYITSEVYKAVSQANPATEEEAERYINNGINSIIQSWHLGVVAMTSENSEDNINDVMRERKQERIERARKLARDVGAVALGSLPLIGAMFYLDRKKNQ